jgi:hypothetical protein
MKSEKHEDRRIESFWKWFSKIDPEVLSDCGEEGGKEREKAKAALISKIDKRVQQLGDVTWEVGPGKVKPWAFIISPNGRPELVRIADKIIACAPNSTEWEFYSSKPPKEWSVLKFRMLDDATQQWHEIDASGWKYVIFLYDDGMCDIVVLTGPGSAGVDMDVAARILVEGLLGERSIMERINKIESVPSYDGIMIDIQRLPDHFKSVILK